MRIDKNYDLNDEQAIASLEDLADSFIEKRYREYTVKGIVKGESREPARELLPEENRDAVSYSLIAGLNRGILKALLGCAFAIKKEKHASCTERFMLEDFLANNIAEQETVYGLENEFGVFGRDDGCWYFSLTYFKNNMMIHLADNHDRDPADQGFTKLYQRFFGDVFERYMPRDGEAA